MKMTGLNKLPKLITRRGIINIFLRFFPNLNKFFIFYDKKEKNNQEEPINHPQKK